MEIVVTRGCAEGIAYEASAVQSSHTRSAQSCRHELMQFLRGHTECAENLFTSEIVIGELIANTVEHAPGLVEIAIDWTGKHPIATFQDAGPGIATAPHSAPVERLSENGRGLMLIREFSLDLTIVAAPGYGSKITVTLPLRREDEGE